MNGAVIPKLIWLVITFSPTSPGEPFRLSVAPDQQTCEMVAHAYEQFTLTRCIPFETRK